MPKDVTVQLGSYDVCVVGAGLAGVCAAVSAAEAGARVAIASAGHTFSGSSFFGGTWGLGLVGARDEGDVDDFVKTILEVGQGVADPELARALVEGVPGAVSWLEGRGVRLAHAEAAGEREFVPCFDHAQRSWRGIERASVREALDRELDRLGVERLGGCKLLGVLAAGGGAAGRAAGRGAAGRAADGGSASAGGGAAAAPSTLVFYSREADLVCSVEAGAVVLASGGYGGLFGRTLTMPDVLGDAHAIALGLGCELTNIEFMQIMPGLVAPVAGVVFNEKAFRYARVEGAGAEACALMDARAGHGPFTASRPDRAVDFAVAAAGDAGAAVSFDMPAELPEFMRTYADWFRNAFGKDPTEGVRIAPYAHAANGGIRVDARAATGVAGVFACGECTGGMHGADRIGGLASANALVFGIQAGRSAAEWAEGCAGDGPSAALAPERLVGSPRAGEALAGLRRAMSEHAMIFRSEEGLAAAQAAIARLRGELDEGAEPCEAQGYARDLRCRHALTTADALTAAMRARKESRGAHFRADFPQKDEAFARPSHVRLEGGALEVAFG